MRNRTTALRTTTATVPAIGHNNPPAPIGDPRPRVASPRVALRLGYASPRGRPAGVRVFMGRDLSRKRSERNVSSSRAMAILVRAAASQCKLGNMIAQTKSNCASLHLCCMNETCKTTLVMSARYKVV